MRRGDAWRRTQGQASILLIGGLAGVLIAVVIAGAVAMAVGREAAAQRAADLAAVAGAKAMHANYQRLFEPAFIDDVPNPRHLTKADYLNLGRAAARATATANGAPHTVICFPDESTIAPVRINVAVRETVEVGRERARIHVDAEAQLGASADDRVRARRRLRRPARVSPGQADASRRRAGLRPDGARRPAGRGRARHQQRLPLGRRAGGAVRPQPEPEDGRAARPVAAPPRHGARLRPTGRLRLA